jgi:hypothetical protein
VLDSAIYAISMMLEFGHWYMTTDSVNSVAVLVFESGLLDKLEDLQKYPNEEIYQKIV